MKKIISEALNKGVQYIIVYIDDMGKLGIDEFKTYDELETTLKEKNNFYDTYCGLENYRVVKIK